MSVFLAGAFSVISSFASAAFFLSAAFGIVKTVLYFTKKDEQQAITAKSQLEWNTGRNILIGHQDMAQSVLTAIVNKDENQINGQTYINVVNRLTQIAREFGLSSDVHVHIRTPGGQMFYATAIARRLSQWQGRVVAHIHDYSFSGGTIISLACAEICMTPSSALGPIDPQVPVKSDHFSIVQYLHAVGVDPRTISHRSLETPLFLFNESREKQQEKKEQEKKEQEKKEQEKKEQKERKNDNDDDDDDEDDVCDQDEIVQIGGNAIEIKEETTLTSSSSSSIDARIKANMKTHEAMAMLLTYRRELREILARNYTGIDQEATFDKIINFLLEDRPHCMPIYYDDCRRIGLNVRLIPEYVDNVVDDTNAEGGRQQNNKKTE